MDILLAQFAFVVIGLVVYSLLKAVARALYKHLRRPQPTIPDLDLTLTAGPEKPPMSWEEQDKAIQAIVKANPDLGGDDLEKVIRKTPVDRRMRRRARA